MKFLGSARAAVLAVAVLTEVTGLGLAVPALAAPRPAHQAITFTAGGDRTSNNAVSGTAGVGFTASDTNPDSCTTAANGTCTLASSNGTRQRVAQESAPAGWFLSPRLGISPDSHTSDVVSSDYSTLTTRVPFDGVDIPPSTSGSTTSPDARSGIWAVSRNQPALPPGCGLSVALLFDLSFSVGDNLREVKQAGIGYVNALAGTPSSVALYTMGTHAPVNSTNNSNFPLTPVTTDGNVAALTHKINGYTIGNNPPQYTNWDQGLWQIASAEGPVGGTRAHYDAVIMISDGDPTVYGPTGIGQTSSAITRFIDVENGIFSANALKAEGTKVVAVGIGATNVTALNLRAISGPREGSDYFTTNFDDLEDLLRELALSDCSGTVNVTKLVIPEGSKGGIADAVPAPGWTMRATGPTVAPAAAVTNETGAVSFTTTGTREPVTVTEDVKSGYRHFPVGGQNAVCENLAGDTVPVADAGTGTGFTVSAVAGDIITCKIYNQQLARSVVTTRLSAADGEIPVGGSASDAATLDGVTGIARGSLEYRFYGSQAACDSDVAAFPGTAPSGGTLVSTVPVTGGKAPPSSTVPFPAAGTFYWAAFYSGDPDDLPAASLCATEPLVVTPASSRVTTVLSAAGGISVGGSVSDSATLHGVTATASGTVDYRFYGSLAACDTDVAAFIGTAPSGGTLVSTVPVTNGTVPASATRTFPAAGTFYWAAFYSGDPNNRAAASLCATEPLVVTPASSRVTTVLSASGGVIGVGGSASDTATLLGVTGTAGGTVDYRFYDSPAACDSDVAAFIGTAPSGGTPVSIETVTNGAVAASAAATFPAAGTFYWAAFYSGDPNNRSAASECATEPLVVTPAPSRITTQLSVTGGEIPVGGSVSDAATLLGVTGNAVGSVDYRFYGSLSACETDVAAFPGTAPSGGTLVSTETVTNGAVAASAAATFPAAGTFYWGAFYSGGPNNLPAASNCATEPLVVTLAPSQVATELSAADGQISVAGSASDAATLLGVTGTAGGTVEYRYYDSLTACQSATSASPPAGGTLVSTVPVSGGVVPSSAAATFPAAGTFYWAAFYSGDAGDQPAASDCSTEPLVVTPAPSRVTTELSAADGEIPVGGSATDSATLHAVTGTASGTVEYRLYASLAACEAAILTFPPAGGGTLVSTATVTDGTVPASDSVTFPAAGTFFWAAFYSGDSSNRAAASHCVTEPLVVSPAASQVNTQLSVAGEIGVGGSVSDAATLVGTTGTASGTVNYRLYDSPAACDTDVAAFPGTAPSGGTSVSTATVSGGLVPLSDIVTFPSAGTFFWAAFYSGDTSNLPAASDCATEPLVVNPAASRLTTALSAAGGEIPVGGSASDSATLHGVTGTASGAVAYRFYGSLSACASDVAAFPATPPPGGTLVSTVTVTGGVVPPSAAHTFGAAGTFFWAAFYSGDPNNLPAASVCAAEPLVVTSAPSEVTTQLSAADGEIDVGAVASDSATLHGVTGTAVGSVEYRFYGSLSACETDVAPFPATEPVGGTLVSTVTVSGGAVPPSAAATFGAAGTFYWAAFYSGDTSNLAAASVCATEPLVVNQAVSRVSTQLSAAGGEIGVGESVSDDATLLDVTGTAVGSVEYRFYGSPSACDTDVAAFPGTAPSGGTLVSTEPVSNGVAPPSAAHRFGAAGTFFWAAFYSGGPSNLPAASNCATEPLVVNLAASQVTTVLSPAGGEIGVSESASDAATLHGVTGTAGGSVAYRFYDSLSACETDAAAFPGTVPSGGTLVSTVTVTNGVAPASAAAAFGAAGTFYWAAFYTGDQNNHPAGSICASEPLMVNPAESVVTTRLSAATGEIPVGGSASDAATLAGVTGTAGGSVEYRFYGSLAACDTDTTAFPGTAPSGGTTVSTVTVSGGVVPASGTVPFPVAGTFYWAAFYSGDTSNVAAASICASEPLVVNPAASQLSTVLSAVAGEISVGGSASDAATLAGVTGTAGGSVEYRFYGSLAACDTDTAAFPGTAPSGGTTVSTVTVSGGVVPASGTVPFPAAGTFYWAAFYSGDPSNRAAASDCASEPLVVNPAASQVTTQLLPAGGEIPVGGSASDAATLAGVTGTAGGSVEYRFYGSLAACDTDTAAFPGTAPSGGTTVSTEPVSAGTAPASNTVPFPAAGTFYWAAFYSGDPSNQGAASDCVTEPLVVNPAASQVTTALSPAGGEIPVGGSASDSATLAQVTGTAGGSVEYRFYGSLSACDTDTAAFPGTAPSGGTAVSTVPVTGGSAPASDTFRFPGAGTVYWAAFYSGDPDNLAAASICASEPLVVNPAASQVTTVLSAAGGEIPVGGSASDSATLNGVTGTAGGNVAYRFYGSLAACDTDAAAFPGTAPSGGTLVSTVPVTAGSAPASAGHAFPVAGTFFWAAFYFGDPDNLAAASICATEPLVVTAAPSEVTTQLSAAGAEIPVGGSASDSATLNGVTGTAGGNVAYRFYGSLSACESDAAAFPGTAPSGGTLVSTVLVSGGTVPASGTVTFPVAGTFYWAAFYSGDPSNSGAASDCVTEPLVVTAAPSEVTTQLSAAGAEIPVGGSVSDSATLHGVTGNAVGTVDYRFYGSLSACESDVAAFPGTSPSGGTLVSTETVSGGVVPASAARTFDAAGTFYWAAFYSGDPGDRAADSICATEPLVVAQVPPPPASVIVNMDWVIDGVLQHAPSQDPNFQASLSLIPLIPPDKPATWGQERFGYSIGQDIQIAVTDVVVPPGCSQTVSGQLGTHTLTQPRNEFLVTATATCDTPSPDPGVGTHMTLVKRISNLFVTAEHVPLTAWTLTARRAPGEPPVISGTTGVTENVEPGVQYLLAESHVPGYRQLRDPALLTLSPGATGSWRCVENEPGGQSGLEDFDGGDGLVVVQPGQHVICTAFNRLTRTIPVGPPATGGGLAAASRSTPAVAVGLALMAAGALLGLGGLRWRRRARSGSGT